jgi:prevent-host-death family protein
MKSMSALQAKNKFGEFIEQVQREPVVITKRSREVGTMYSMRDIEDMADNFLSEPIKREVEQNLISVQDALLKQAKMNERIAQSRQEIASGQGIEMDDTFFDNLRNRVHKIANPPAQ